MSLFNPLRCACHGQCSSGGNGRKCADPDLAGRCRAVQGQLHPRSSVAAEVRIDPVDGRALCGDCWRAVHPPVKRAPVDSYQLFDGGSTQ